MAREWVGDRMITGVEVEMEGERWVSDVVPDEGVEDKGSVASSKGRDRGVSFESQRKGRVGEWRRRRWVRLVERVAFGGDGKDEKG